MAKGDLIPTKKMIVEARHLPKIGTVRKKTDVGITCLSQAPDDQSLVVFGTESGAILEGTLTTPTVIHGPNMNHIPGKNYLGESFVKYRRNKSISRFFCHLLRTELC